MPTPPTFPALLRRADLAGAALSSACALHCLAMPAVLAALPALGGGWLADRAFERAAVLFTVSLAAACLWRGWCRHGRAAMWLPFAGGAVTLLTVQALAGPACCAAERTDWREAALMFGGGLGLVTAHLLNHRRLRGCACCGSPVPAA